MSFPTSPYRTSAETLRSLAHGSISGSYAAVGTPLTNPARLVCLTNNTDGDMLFSLDGINDTFFVAKGSFKLFDVTANRRSIDLIFAFAANTQFYVKQSTAPTAGSVYIEVLYGD